MSNLRAKEDFESAVRRKSDLLASLRSSRRGNLMKSRRGIIDLPEKVTLLPPLKEVESVCILAKNGDLNAIKTLQSYLNGDQTTNRLITNCEVCYSLINLIPNSDDTVKEEILKLFVSFTCEKQTDIYSKHLIQSGLLNVLDLLLQSKKQVMRTCLWLLANMCSDGSFIVQSLFTYGIVCKLEYILAQQNYDSDILHIVTWLYSNVCRGKVSYNNEYMSKIFAFQYSIISKAYFVEPDNDCISDALWGYAFAAESNVYDQIFVRKEILTTIMPYSASDDKRLFIPAFRLMGNLSAKEDKYCELLIQNDVLNYFEEVLKTNSKPDVLQEMFWIISNLIAVDNWEISLLIIKTTNFVAYACEGVINGGYPLSVLKEMSYVVANAAYLDITQYLIELMKKFPVIVAALVANLTTRRDDMHVISITLKSILNIMKFGNENGVDVQVVFDSIGLEQALDDLIEEKGLSSISARRIQILLQTYYPNSSTQKRGSQDI